MTRIRVTRDIVVPIPFGTHRIERGTCFYIAGPEADVIANGAAIRIPGTGDIKCTKRLFVGDTIEIVEDPIPF